MAQSSTRRGFLFGDKDDLWHTVYENLMSFDRPDLTETINALRQDGQWPRTFVYGLEGLQAFRDFYGDHSDLLTPEQLQKVEQYDEEWTLELLDQMNRHQGDGGSAYLKSFGPLLDDGQ